MNPSTRTNRIRRHTRTRAKISGTAVRPRVAVFKSSAHVYVQAIDDVAGVTIAAVNDAHVKVAKAGHEGLGTKAARAHQAGIQLAELLKGKGVSSAVFDTSGFAYHGRLKAVAEALRSNGIQI